MIPFHETWLSALPQGWSPLSKVLRGWLTLHSNPGRMGTNCWDNYNKDSRRNGLWACKGGQEPSSSGQIHLCGAALQKDPPHTLTFIWGNWQWGRPGTNIYWELIVSTRPCTQCSPILCHRSWEDWIYAHFINEKYVLPISDHTLPYPQSSTSRDEQGQDQRAHVFWLSTLKSPF